MEYTQDELEFMLGATLAQSDAYPKLKLDGLSPVDYRHKAA